MSPPLGRGYHSYGVGTIVSERQLAKVRNFTLIQNGMLFALCKGMDVSKSLLGVRVLVVEDDPGSAKLMSLLLTDAGADVQTVADAESAMSALRTFPAELVVLDLVLPGMNGLAMARMLKQRLPHVVIVAVSAINGPNAVAAALDAGCAAYMKKPIDTETFAQSLSKHLGRIK